mmetsp:Transcript_99/g.270  ORF Transcript_99/g.270 Transcript_99/m.270 type:complete len:201 (+) Transcript_99:465-1067(+)
MTGEHGGAGLPGRVPEGDVIPPRNLGSSKSRPTLSTTSRSIRRLCLASSSIRVCRLPCVVSRSLCSLSSASTRRCMSPALAPCVLAISLCSFISRSSKEPSCFWIADSSTRTPEAAVAIISLKEVRNLATSLSRASRSALMARVSSATEEDETRLSDPALPSDLTWAMFSSARSSATASCRSCLSTSKPRRISASRFSVL